MTAPRAMFLLLLLSTLSPVGNASAQSASDYDMALPSRSSAACDGPLCTLVNPAGLSFAGDGQFLFLHSEGWQVQGRPAARADGLMMNAFGMGFSVQYVQPDVEGSSETDYLKYDLVLPLFRHRRLLSTAVGLSILDPTETAEDSSVDVNLGLMMRPWSFLSFGLVGRQLASAAIHGGTSRPSLEMGLALRPLWFASDRLTLAADLRLVEDAADPPLRFTALARPFDGLLITANADTDGAFGVGLQVDFLRAGVGGYTWFDSDGENQGMTLTAGASLAAGPGLVLHHERSAEIILDAAWNPGTGKGSGFLGRGANLLSTLHAIRRASHDPRVDSLILRVQDVRLPFHAAQELRRSLAAFRLSGKKVAVHLESATGNTYYLSSGADAIYLNPAGAFHVTGRAFQATFFRGFLDLIGIRAEAHRVGDYKSAVESLTRDRPSPAFSEVLNSLADQASMEMYGAIARGRGLPLEKVKDLIDSGVMLPRQALEADLIDGIAYEDEIDLLVADAFGHPAWRIENYPSQRSLVRRWSNRPSLAIVHAEGSIARQPGLTGGMPVREIVESLRALQRDGSIQAVVLRIDSGGGSILASELIYREVDKLAQVKPVIVSMGAVAASGGYYIGCPADWIVANPNTITGSIGVFNLLFDASELMAKLGIHREVIKRGELADLYGMHRPRSPDEHALLQEMVEGYYRDFLDRVAEGRQMTREAVHAVAQGRVWTGAQAKERGLVDELGGLERAIQVAKDKAGMADEEIHLVHLPRRSFSLRGLVSSVLGETRQEDGLLDFLQTRLARLRLLAALSEEPAVAMLPWMWMD